MDLSLSFSLQFVGDVGPGREIAVALFAEILAISRHSVKVQFICSACTCTCMYSVHALSCICTCMYTV